MCLCAIFLSIVALRTTSACHSRHLFDNRIFTIPIDSRYSAMAGVTSSRVWRQGMPQITDIAVNLTDPVFRGIYRGKSKHTDDMHMILSRAFNAAVNAMVITGTDYSASIEALELAQSHPALYSTVGIHPTCSTEFEKPSAGPGGVDLLGQLREIAQRGMAEGKVVAYGELGLDYDRLHFASKEVQLKWFQAQLELASELRLPLFLHNRNTGGDFVRILQDWSGRLAGGVVHSFTGDADEMKALVGLGYYIGINGCSLKTEENLAVAAQVPLDRLLLETDAPWCEIRPSHASAQYVSTKWPTVRPEKWDEAKLVKGRCEPCHVVQVAEVMAGLKEISLEELLHAVQANVQVCFASTAIASMPLATCSS